MVSDVEAAKRLLLDHPQVLSIVDFHVWGLDDGLPILSAVLTVEAPELPGANRVAHELRTSLQSSAGVKHATLECRHATAGTIDAC
ncbi:MAG: Co/Zn/Cd efflux system component [Myxococcota bacterium]